MRWHIKTTTFCSQVCYIIRRGGNHEDCSDNSPACAQNRMGSERRTREISMSDVYCEYVVCSRAQECAPVLPLNGEVLAPSNWVQKINVGHFGLVLSNSRSTLGCSEWPCEHCIMIIGTHTEWQMLVGVQQCCCCCCCCCFKLYLSKG
jgi:hypothetical protein